MRNPWLIILMLLVLNPGGASQTSHRKPNISDIDAVPATDRPQPVLRIDREKVQREAEELHHLAQTVPDDVHKATQGVLSKDLKDRLKRIEKLAKSLRGDLLLQ